MLTAYREIYAAASSIETVNRRVNNLGTSESTIVRQGADRILIQFPGLKERLLEDGGQLRRFINIYINQEDIRFLQGPTTSLKQGDEVSIVPAIAGGR